MGKTLAELHSKGGLMSSASVPNLEKTIEKKAADAGNAKAFKRRYTFSVNMLDPVSPKTPALVAASWESQPREGHRADLVVSVPAMLDMSFITIQGRMDPVQAALREDPDAFDPIEHRMEYDMLNSMFKTLQNIAYHLNKLCRSLSTKDDKYNRPEDGVDGLDMVAGVRGAISRSQEASKRLAQLVKQTKNMYGHESTRDVLGDEGMTILEQIEAAMTVALTKSARLLDAMEAAKKSRAKGLLQKATAALFQVQADQGSTSAVLRVHFVAWKDALLVIKAERAADEVAAAA
jgi:hypothetical protein